MKTELEDLLRDGMERYTAGVQAPAGLARAAARRRRRRLVARTAGVAALAALLAAGIVVFPSGAQPATAPARATRPAGQFGSPAAAYLVADIRKALAASSARDDVVEARMPGVAGDPGRSSLLGVVSWSAPGRNATELRDAGGLVAAGGYREANGMVTAVFVSYRDRTWNLVRWKAGRGVAFPLPAILAPVGTVLQIELQRSTRGCAPRSTGGGLVSRMLAFSWPDFIRGMLGCGGFDVVGHQRVDGVDALLLASGPLRNHLAVHGSSLSELLWVSPTTYLPVRIVITGGAAALQTDFRWLPPTPANLARTVVRVPAGFHRVPFPSLGTTPPATH